VRVRVIVRVGLARLHGVVEPDVLVQLVVHILDELVPDDVRPIGRRAHIEHHRLRQRQRRRPVRRVGLVREQTNHRRRELARERELDHCGRQPSSELLVLGEGGAGDPVGGLPADDEGLRRLNEAVAVGHDERVRLADKERALVDEPQLALDLGTDGGGAPFEDDRWGPGMVST
jgi:hypothetical protein